MRTESIATPSNDATINICLDTLAKEKQALVFCNTKRGAESQAERLASKIATRRQAWTELAERAEHVLAAPTRQCKRLAKCLSKGVAFHHAGLHQKQRELIEEEFRKGNVTTICSTPTLAMGLDLPAFRVIIRDLKRYGGRGMQDIPVLEYEQQAGRAGRPGKEEYGEAIAIAQNVEQEELITEQYIRGEPEDITSKLAVEPVLRTYVLSLIAAEFITSHEGLYAFFERTFYAHEYGDTARLHSILDAMVNRLREWEFLEGEHRDFQSADTIAEGRLRATPIGKRVAELYLDPFTAKMIVDALRRSDAPRDFAILHLLASCLELRPLLRPRTRELDELLDHLAEHVDTLIVPEPVQWSDEYEEFLMSVKTAFFLQDWIDETLEDTLLERYNIGPGEVHAKRERADWLLYASEELCRMLGLRFQSRLARMRLRLKYGAREELLPLLKLKNVGRVRARKLFTAGIRDVGDLKRVDIGRLATLIGDRVAGDVKQQVGETVDVVKPRKGQRSMADYMETKGMKGRSSGSE